MDADELKRQFGLRVRSLRRRDGLTQEQLAEAIERSVDTISNIETGRLSTRIETAIKMAAVFRMTLSELFDVGEESPAGDRQHRAAVERLVRMLEPQDTEVVTAVTEIAERIIALREPS